MDGSAVSRLAREFAELRRDEEALWNGACAEARRAGLTVSARDTEAGRLGAAASAETDRAWASLVGACGSVEEARVRASHYLGE